MPQAQPQSLKEVQFEMTGGGADWYLPYSLLMDGLVWDTERDQVALGMTPDGARPCDDYQFRRRYYGPVPDFWDAPYYFTTSDAADGVVTLVNPNVINIIVPYHVMKRLGPGGVTVGVQYRTKDGTDRRTQLLTGRLPVKYGGL